jgi:hypothetical protein
MGWGDRPGAGTDELVRVLAKFDPEGLAQALGRDEDHTEWFNMVCGTLLPGYMYSLDMADRNPISPGPLPVYPVRNSLPEYSGPDLTWPPGWKNLWRQPNALRKQVFI